MPSLSHSVARVYLYKCGALSPSSCIQKTPEVFDSFVNYSIGNCLRNFSNAVLKGAAILDIQFR